MNRRLNHFLVRTVLANIFEGIYRATAFIRIISVKLTWLVFLGIAMKFGLHYAAGLDWTSFIDDRRNVGGITAFLILLAFNLLQPKLIFFFTWVLRSMYQFDEAERKSSWLSSYSLLVSWLNALEGQGNLISQIALSTPCPHRHRVVFWQIFPRLFVKSPTFGSHV